MALCSLFTAVFLFLGLLVSFLIAFAINSLPMHIPESTLTTIDIAITVVILFASGGFWGRSIASITKSEEKRRMLWAGLLSYAPSIFLAVVTLGRLEVLLVERRAGPDLPVHIVFTLLFVPAAAIVAGAGGFAMGIAKKDVGLALQLGLSSGLVGGLCFLTVNILMDTLGWRVGAPRAAERATMLTVMMAGSLAAALGGGATIGYFLARQRKREETLILGEIQAYEG